MDPSPSPSVSPLLQQRRQLLVPLLCWLALVVDGYDIIIYGATLPGILETEGWGVTTQSAAMVGSISMIGVAVGAVFAGVLTDVYGRRKLFLISLSLFSIAALGCALAPNFAVFGFWRVVSGLGIGGIMPTIVALAAEFSAPGRRSRTVGLVMTGPLVGGLLGSSAALMMLESAGFRPIYALGAVALITVLPVAYARLPESAVFLRSQQRHAEAEAIASRYGVQLVPTSGIPSSEDSRSPIGKLFEGRNRWSTPGLWAMMFICLLLTYTVLTWLPQMLVAGGMELNEALQFFVYFNISAVVGTALWAFLADRIGSKLVVTMSLTLSAVGYVMLAVGGTTWVGIGVVIAGFGGGSGFSYLADHIAGFYPAEIRASGLGWATGFGRLAGIAGPSYGGLFVTLSAGNVSMVGWALAAPAAAGAVLMSILPRGPHSSMETPTMDVPRDTPPVASEV